MSNKRSEARLLRYSAEGPGILVDNGKTKSGYVYMRLLGEVTASGKTTDICVFQLPFFLDIHMLSIPRQSEVLSSSNSLFEGLEPILLEGDFNTDFTLYAESGQQMMSRYVLDPEAMAFTVDFCKQYCWEIVNGALYFLCDQATLPLVLADDFIKQIRPASVSPSVAEYSVAQPQVQEVLKPIEHSLPCPVCSADLHRGKNWLACANGHGCLLTGSQLINVREGERTLVKELSRVLGRPAKVVSLVVDAPHSIIDCPNCDSQMKPVKYQMSTILLDICPSCLYRWVDGVELDAVLGVYRNED